MSIEQHYTSSSLLNIPDNTWKLIQKGPGRAIVFSRENVLVFWPHILPEDSDNYHEPWIEVMDEFVAPITQDEAVALMTGEINIQEFISRHA